MSGLEKLLYVRIYRQTYYIMIQNGAAIHTSFLLNSKNNYQNWPDTEMKNWITYGPYL